MTKLPVIATAVVGVALFVLCSSDQLSHAALQQSVPALVAYGLVFLLALPVFSAFMVTAWRAA